MNSPASIWVKICANTSLEDALLAAKAGADAAGFVFAPSPRRVTTAQVAVITPHLPQTLEKIGVFVDASLDEMCTAVHACGLTGVQIHSHHVHELTARLRERLGSSVRIVRTVHFGPEAAAQAAMLAQAGSLDAILVDSRTTTAVGGTGITFDWTAASTSLFQNANPRHRLIAAGGLTPANVADAIATLRPWGVDVASGVEAAPGRKDPLKVREFVANARAAKRG